MAPASCFLAVDAQLVNFWNRQIHRDKRIVELMIILGFCCACTELAVSLRTSKAIQRQKDAAGL